MKKIRRILLVLVLLLVVGGIFFYLHLDSLVKSTVETQATNSLNLPTTLGSAHLALFGGNVSLNELQIASPKGFSAPHMFELGKLGVAVEYGQLRQDPIRIKQIALDKPKFVLEQVDGKWNFKAVMDQQPKPDPNPTPSGDTKPLKLIIDELSVTDAQVTVRPGKVPGLGEMKEFSFDIPSMTLKNIGNSDNSHNGAAIKDVVSQLATALAGKIDMNKLPEQLKGMLQSQVTEVAGKLGGEFSKQLGSITGNLQGELGKIAPGVDMGKVIPKELKNPTDVIGGLLGGKKDEKKN